MLADTASCDMALYALEMLPGERVDGALREAMTRSKGRMLVGLINVLGKRGVKQATGRSLPM